MNAVLLFGKNINKHLSFSEALELFIRTRATSLMPADLPVEDDPAATQLCGRVLYTEGMPSSDLYVIKEDEVGFYMVREEKRVVVQTPVARPRVWRHSATAQLLGKR